MDHDEAVRRIQKRMESAEQAGLRKAVESIRYQSDSMAMKGGAVLGYSGLIMASDLVFLTSSAEMLKPTILSHYIAVIALFALCASSYAAARSIYERRDFSEDGAKAAAEFHQYLVARRGQVEAATRFAEAGTLGFLISVAVTVGDRLT